MFAADTNASCIASRFWSSGSRSSRPQRAVDRAVTPHRSGASIAAVAARRLDGEQLVEVEIDNRLQLFCGSGFGEVFRQTIEPGAVFVL
jgi:hypothetical protein